MPYTIAVAGKGGTGKTTFAALAATVMKNHGRAPILAVDADPNSNFGDSLGIKYSATISDVLEKTRGMRDVPAGVNKMQMIEFELHKCIVETPGIDLIVMGKPEGAECYCAANHMLRSYIATLAAGYPYAVIDNEAGMEHLSRKTTQNIDALYMVSDFSAAGIRSVARIKELVKKLGLSVKNMCLIVNKAPALELPQQILSEIQANGLVLEGVVPYDEAIPNAEISGKPISELPESSPAVQRVKTILKI